MLSIVSPLLTILNQIKVYHWQTTSFSEHKALDMAYESLGELVDEFVEVCDKFTNREIFLTDASGKLVKDSQGNLKKRFELQS